MNGYPAAANPTVVRMAHPFDLSSPRVGLVVFLLTWLVLLVTMVYGPIAAALVELFPTRACKVVGGSFPGRVRGQFAEGGGPLMRAVGRPK